MTSWRCIIHITRWTSHIQKSLTLLSNVAFLLGCPATAVLGWVGHNYSLQAGMAMFGGTYALGAIAIFVARAFFFQRYQVQDERTA